jgi:hypothetical protein
MVSSDVPHHAILAMRWATDELLTILLEEERSHGD